MTSPGFIHVRCSKNFFVEEGTINFDWFIPRDEAVKYFSRDRYEKHLLDFIKKQFVFDDEKQMDFYETMNSDDLTKENVNSEVCIHSL